MPEVLYLTHKDVVGLGLTDEDVLEATRMALVEHGTKRCEMPAKIGLHPVSDSIMHAMPAYVPAVNACGLKWAAGFPQNVERGLPQISGVLVLNDTETGWPIAIMDAIWITARRTPAVSALAAELLARRQSEVLGIIGCGVQGRGHLEMLPRVLPNLREIRLFDRRAAVARELADIADAGDGIGVRCMEGVEAAVRDADVVVTAMAILPRPDPVVRDEWVKEGALVLPVDFDTAWEFATFERAAKFIVDSIEEMEYFRSIGYLANGLPAVHAEIGEVIAARKPGREADSELIVNLNIGMGVEDVVLARKIYARATESEVGRLLPL